MDAWLMWTLGALVVVLPFALMVAFNGVDEADSRGRRISRRWRAKPETK